MAKMRDFDSRDSKDHVRALADYIEECARENLAFNAELDRQNFNDALIQDAMSGVRVTFDGLAEIISPRFADDPQRLDDAYGLVWHLIYKSFIIGTSMAAGPELVKTHTANMRDTKTILANERTPRLDTAITDEAQAQKRTLANSIEFAGLIRPGVMKRLKIEPEKPKEKQKWPSPSLIRTRIAAIKSANSSRTSLSSANSSRTNRQPC